MNNKYVKFFLSASLVLIAPGVNMNLYEDEVKLKDDQLYSVFSVEEMKIDRNSSQFALYRHKMWVGIPTMRQDIRSFE